MRFVLSLFLALALGAFAHGAADATINLEIDQLPTPIGANTQLAVASAEKSVEVKVSPGRPQAVQFVCTNAWKLRTTTATSSTDLPVAAGQPYVLPVYATRTVYVLRDTTDGTMTMTPLGDVFKP